MEDKDKEKRDNLTKMEDDLKKNGRRPQKNEMEDDLQKIWKTTSKNGRRP
jgi:hypothetical protein